MEHDGALTGESAPRVVAVVPHTHWDREWYASFATFRLRLVDLLDDLLPRLEADPSYARFLLDGQLAMVDDYLAVRPEAEDRLRRLAASERVAMGPWYVLPDEFCVSAETLVRNLELGLERAAAFGGAMPVGYLPDMFGHAAQMPQLLRLGGFEHAVVWRGVPATVDRTAFWWSAPDGSTVRAEYLPVGYGNGAAVPDDAKRLLERVRAHEAELAPLLAPDAPLLWMNGTDHQAPQPWLGRVVAEANSLSDEYRLTVTSLPEYLAGAPTEGLPRWTGELRSGARANLLPGVLSNRVDVKTAAARAEHALERRAEPLSALFLPPARWPASALRLAWLEVVRNAAHDSSCACSADEVVDAVLARYAEAASVGAGLASRALASLGGSLAAAGPVAVNATARARSGLLEVVVAGGPQQGSQVVTAHPSGEVEHVVPGAAVSTLLGQVRNDAMEADATVVAVETVDDEVGLCEVHLRTGAPSGIGPSTASDLAELYARAGAARARPVRVRVEQEPVTRALVRVADVPPFGWRVWEPGELGVEPAVASGLVLDNGLVRVEVDPGDGTFSLGNLAGLRGPNAVAGLRGPNAVTGLRGPNAVAGLRGPNGVTGLDRLIDGGDAGDTYNWSPPDPDEIVDHPESVRVAVAEGGPLRAALDVVRTFAWPERADQRRQGRSTVAVTTRLELRAGERIVRVTTTFDNRCRDHRLRAHLPLPAPATVSRAGCAFAVVERGLTAEGGPHEAGIPTFPARRFVTAGGLTVVHEGLLEYELVDGGRALALTLLRAVGLLSGTHLATRPQPAGPPLAVEAAQLQGPVVRRYAVAVGDVDPWALADDAFVPLEAAWGTGDGTRPPAGSALTVEGAEVSALRRVAGGLELRVFNPTSTETKVTVPGHTGWLVDLRGRPLEPFAGSFPLRPWGIATARLVPGTPTENHPR